MSETANVPATVQPISKAPVPIGDRGLVLTDLDSLWRFSTYVAASGLAPKGIEKPEAIFTAVQLGLEIGLSPMCALQNVAVINGRPSIYGDAALGLVRASGKLEWITEKYEGDGDQRKAVCTTKRRGDPEPMVSEFSVADARRANLWGKAGPWTQYPDRMLRFRARGFNLRDNFGDILKGLRTAEEVQDYEGDVIDAKPITPPVGRLNLRPKANGTHAAPIITQVISEPAEASSPTGEQESGVDESPKVAETPTAPAPSSGPEDSAARDLIDQIFLLIEEGAKDKSAELLTKNQSRLGDYHAKLIEQWRTKFNPATATSAKPRQKALNI